MGKHNTCAWWKHLVKLLNNVLSYLSIITIFNTKQRFPILNCKLWNNRNSSKHISMHSDIMAIHLFQNLPLLKPFVDCFLSWTDSLHHLLFLCRDCDASGAFHSKGSLTKISIIFLYPLKWVQMGCKRWSKKFQVIVDSWSMGPTDLANLPA